ncbi:ELOV7-like protein [Mya arenaria]|uniref:Elongation of very long chain fatty acids protein n=1 Tax=Mya arenaria TaxID=6604 RepID=A0ABY7FF08_MYAAR|nr:ELOV7-like protein [Mya arenaria]
MSVIAQVQDFYNYLCSDIDQRVRDWPLMSRPIEPLLLVIAYLLFVALGPRWMATRKPFKLQSVIVFYNFFMVALCSYTVHEVFFILRKKTNQVTFLHVFHHGCLPVFWWWGVKAVPGGFGTFHGFVNCCVHVVMYLYYGISALGPDYQKYIWWKKYVTKFQLAQFFIVTIHNSQYLFRECAYPWKYVAFIQGFTTIIAGLFLNFYVKAYRRKTHSAVSEKNRNVSNGHYSNGDAYTHANGLISNENIINGYYTTTHAEHRHKHLD